MRSRNSGAQTSEPTSRPQEEGIHYGEIPSSSHACSVLVIESDALLLTAIGGALDMSGHKATLARTEGGGSTGVGSKPVDLIILGIDDLEKGCGLAARLRSQAGQSDIPIIFMVPELSSHWAASLQEQGGVFCILRSNDPHDLLDLVGRALWMPHLARAAPIRLPRTPRQHRMDQAE